MKINGLSIKGIFQYKEGISIWEVNDLIIYDGLIYSVTNTYDGIDNPKESSNCIPYVELHSATEISDLNSTKIIQANAVKLLVNSYFKDLGLNGELSTINASEININNIRTTCAYLLNVPDVAISGVPVSLEPGKHLFRIYLTSDGVIQEIINYKSPEMFYRLITESNIGDWYQLTNGLVSSGPSFNDYLLRLTGRVNSMVSMISEIEDTSRMTYRNKELTYTDPSLISCDVTKSSNSNLYLVGLSYTESDTIYQVSCTIDTRSDGLVPLQNVGSLSFVTEDSVLHLTYNALAGLTSPQIIYVLESKMY